MKFGYLTVTRKSLKKSKSGAMWDCVCNCGNKIIVTTCNLKSSNTQSCGCVSNQIMRETREKNGITKNLIGGRLLYA